VPLALSAAIATAPAHHCLLVDSLGTWLANLLDQEEATWQRTLEDLLHSLQQSPNPIILVTEETGWGVVPAYPMGRLFRDRLGELTRRVGAIADAVYLVVAGYAVDLQQVGTPLAKG
jgi:adenosylcobinamide kinase/adenosylcobinamide-phosphate guanylyltransferase